MRAVLHVRNHDEIPWTVFNNDSGLDCVPPGMMGFVIGIAENIKMKPLLRGAVLGAIVGMAMSISVGEGAVILIVFSIVYGSFIDAVATKFS